MRVWGSGVLITCGACNWQLFPYLPYWRTSLCKRGLYGRDFYFHGREESCISILGNLDLSTEESSSVFNFPMRKKEGWTACKIRIILLSLDPPITKMAFKI